ncbi:EF-P beta-lysylation protein EpmB [Teredinibacter sp. KSP-S5-2]|uniref:EF-P beta-lysylation protein EpmB n=1 Tax=Teredinibacter sp. KSP-S5-2 TaxID=3034506 RepID=UPI00293413CC|nr:EF-P beta-lysylation protein EpmB [Teredinibacter sp. KSP-S5-2]WNO08136.1 EF-P beta-lysylation protein EpmB [Teredinibacter sp. KSP-S5-2]
MIHRTIPTWQAKSWQEELSQLITDPKTLFEVLELPESMLDAAYQAHKAFPIRTTFSYTQNINKGDIHDPLLRQILPIGEELEHVEGYSNDPVGEEHTTVAPGVVHKYHGRVLLIGATQCAINCRYCFRRAFDYSANNPSRAQWQLSLQYIENDPSIEEVILSGGDPLAQSDAQISWLISQLDQISHLRRLRIHTRLPVVLPSRITQNFCRILNNSRLEKVLVIHCNHPRELSSQVSESLEKLAQEGVTLLNQSVLLKGVNDNTDTLKKLSKELFRYRVLPYYLHLLDKVHGAAHFSVSTNTATEVYQNLIAELPGYLVPKLVQEIAGEKSKTLITLT